MTVTQATGPIARSPVTKTAPFTVRWRGLLWPSASRRRRLETALNDLRCELTAREVIPNGESSRDSALRVLADAHLSISERRLDDGWAYLHNAQRIALHSYSQGDFVALVTSLRTQCHGKLRGWRHDAASELLGKAGSVPTREQAQEALKLLHEHYDNTYHKLELATEQLAVLGPTLVLVLVVLIVLAFLPEPYALGQLHPRDLWRVVLLGALGGALSGVRSTTGGAERKIPDRLLDWPVSVLRPILGAAAALGVALLLQVGVGRLGDGSTLALFAAAFLAGFSERWFLSVIEGAPRNEKEPK